MSNMLRLQLGIVLAFVLVLSGAALFVMQSDVAVESAKEALGVDKSSRTDGLAAEKPSDRPKVAEKTGSLAATPEEEEAEEVGFMDDADLIDLAEGTEPLPMVEATPDSQPQTATEPQAPAPVAEEGEIIGVEVDVREGQEL